MTTPHRPERDLNQEPLTNEEKVQLGKLQERYLDLVSNLATSRSAFFNQFLDPRRDIAKECGHPDYKDQIQPQFYRMLYDRSGVGRRVVDIMPDECWQLQPEVYEDEDEDVDTPFEQDWKALSSQLRGQSWYEDEDNCVIWEYLKRVDSLSRIGRFGVLLIGFDDGKSLADPVDGVITDGGEMNTIAGFDAGGPPTPVIPLSLQGTDLQYQGTQFAPSRPSTGKAKQGTKVLFMRAFDESLIQIVRYEADVTCPRFGLPVMYRITFNDPSQAHTGVGLPLATLMVHWSRVIHVADRLCSSEIFGTPAMQPSLNRILDCEKTYGGSAEMYWKGAFPGISFETHPQLGGEVKVDSDSIREQMYEWQNDLQRYLLSTGMTVKTLATQFVDPTPLIDTHVQAICIESGTPQRIFMGSERGELASGQDTDAFEHRKQFRRTMQLTPRLIAPLIDRLIAVGVLRAPKTYCVKWPVLDPLSEADKATIALQLTQALSAYVSGGIENVMILVDYLINIIGLDKSVAEQIVENAQENALNPADSMTLPDPDNPVDAQGNPIPEEPDPTIEEQQAQTDASVPTHEKKLAAAAMKKGVA